MVRRLTSLAALLLAGLCLLLTFFEPPRRRLLALLLPGSTAQTSHPPLSTRPPGPQAREVAVAAMVSPARTVVDYAELFRFVGEHLGEPVRTLHKKTYQEVNDLLLRGEVDVAWVCTGAWRFLAKSGAVVLLAVPEVDGKTTYRSVLVVRADAPWRSLRDLRGTRIVYSDRLSLTGYALPRQLVRELGEDPDRFFASSFFSFSHDASVLAVRRQLADVAGVDSLVFDFLAARNPEEVAGLKVLAASRELPSPPIVVRGSLPRAEQLRWQQVLTTLHQQPRGRALLQKLRIDRFVVPDPAAYENLP